MRYTVLAVLLITVGCTMAGSDFTRIMRQEGIADAKNTGYAAFMCKDSDTFSTGFTGKKNGQPVEGAVCGGMGAGFTVRYK